MMKRILTTLAFTAILISKATAQYENTTINVGQLAPELEMADPQDKAVKLSDMYNKRIVLIDFWASWCGPCRRANPRLVAMYSKYKDQKIKGAKKGFEIVSVSLDKEKDAWIKAIAKDSLYWQFHMSDLRGWSSKAAELYGASFIPQAFLVGPDGKVIAKYQFAEQAEADLEKLLKEGYKKEKQKKE